MKHIPENVKTFPLPDTHLSGAAIMACNIIDHQSATVDCRAQLESLQRAVVDLWRVSHNLSDLFHQIDTALQLAVAAKEHPVFNPPTWFFQAEGVDIKKMLTRRVQYLRAAKVDVDAAWDLLREFAESCHLAAADELLLEVVGNAYGGKGGPDAGA